MTTPSSLNQSIAPALQLTNVVKRFGQKIALNEVSLRVNRNEVVGLIGENGAGKSTLLKLIAGIHQQDGGTFAIHGSAQRLRDAKHAARLGIGVVHQEQSLVGNLTVADNVTLGSDERTRTLMGRSGLLNWKKLNQITEETLAGIGIKIDPRAKVSELSFAQRQMIEIAKAVSVGSRANAPIVVLDEPTSVLETEEIDTLRTEIKKLKQLGSVIFVSHRLQEVLEFSDRIYVLRDGEIVAERIAAETESDELFELMTGRTHMPKRPDALSATNLPSALKIRGASSTEVANVDLDVYKGHIHCLVGSTSSGAEALVRMCFGLDDSATLSVEVNGSSLGKLTPLRSIKAGIAYLPSERGRESTVAGMNVAENMTLTYPVSRGGILESAKRNNLVKHWISQLDIRPPHASAEISSLSGGNQQKVMLAKWLSGEQLQVLLLDHPMRGLDAGAIEYVKQAVRAAAARGIGVLMIADTLEEALELADTISVMKDGKITASFDLSESIPSQVDLLERMV